MKTTKYIIGLLAAVMLAVLPSCRDEFDYPYIGEGEATLSGEIVFSHITNNLGSRSAGDALKHINSLCVLVYNCDDDSTLYGKYTQAELIDYKINQNGNSGMAPDTPVPPGHQAEATTPRATFRIESIPFGKYYIYAVANMGDLEDCEVSTVGNLRRTALHWDSDNIAKNDQMFGYFTPAGEQTSQGFAGPAITVNATAVTIHSWLKRAASKVTVNIDGSKLNDGVKVWIHSIQIKDIPEFCYLGMPNKASDHLIEKGEKITYTESTGAEGHLITNGNDNGEGKVWLASYADGNTGNDREYLHGEYQPALYFYENMQGTGQLKHQDWGDHEVKFPDGNTPGDPGYKDGKASGTYIEVHGYYRNSEGQGPIIYRFMLGKDTERDYNAERNHHFKLTLMLNKDANDSDWHIVYEQEPDIIVRTPYFISYLYDQKMNLPLKVVGGELVSLKAEIPTTNAPYTKQDPNDLNDVSYPANVNQRSWQPVNNDGSDPKESGVYWNGTIKDAGPWNGFLSLVKTTHAAIGTVAQGFTTLAAATFTFNKKYWYGEAITPPNVNVPPFYNNLIPRGYREYEVTPGEHRDDVQGSYSIIRNGAEYECYIPFYTRAKQLADQTAYTGNNPFEAYRRWALVKITAEIKSYVDGSIRTVTKNVIIQQMRRIVNPKGIWRSYNNQDPFHVTMMALEHNDATEFTPLKSIGPWYAVIKSGDWFTLDASEHSKKNPDGTVSGESDSQIDFWFTPKGTTDADKSRCGLIKIYYNNFTCVHLIFVRQGYAPVTFEGSKTKWTSYNLKSKTEFVDDPVLEGSYFRQFNVDNPIAASNNTGDWFDKDGSTRDFSIVGGTSKKWSNITTTAKKWPKFTIGGKTYHVPTSNDYSILDNGKNSKIVYGYGVLYTDGTNASVASKTSAYGAENGAGAATAGKGMRGVFVCDTIDGTNIFFPIGGSGYGRFKQLAPKDKYNRQKAGYAGTLQYANRYAEFPSDPNESSVFNHAVDERPLFWTIYKSPGALYWGDNNYALDINYFSFDFTINTLGDFGLVWTGAAGKDTAPDPSGSDAIQLRLVED